MFLHRGFRPDDIDKIINIHEMLSKERCLVLDRSTWAINQTDGRDVYVSNIYIYIHTFVYARITFSPSISVRQIILEYSGGPAY